MKTALAVALTLLMFPGREGIAQNEYFSHAAQAALDRGFAQPEISYLVLDAAGAVIAERWPQADRLAIPPGSLVKPFLAIAYGEQHNGQFPVVRCLGEKSRCWLPHGHGVLGLEEAVAQSCNGYFLALAVSLDRARAAQAFSRYGLQGPASGADEDSFAGLGEGWREMPLTLARAYLKLAAERSKEIQGRIVRGMLGSAEHGTAREIDAALGKNAALAKTGTAECTHTPRGAADGFTLALYPAEQPRLLLLVRVHGTTGAASAKVAGEMLRTLGAGTR